MLYTYSKIHVQENTVECSQPLVQDKIVAYKKNQQNKPNDELTDQLRKDQIEINLNWKYSCFF